MKLEGAYQALNADLKKTTEMGAAGTVTVELGPQFYGASVTLNAVSADHFVIYQTTPSGGHRSVHRSVLPSANDGSLGVGDTADERTRCVLKLPVHMTSSNEWSFHLPPRDGPSPPAKRAAEESTAVERFVEAEVAKDDVVFWAGWAQHERPS